MRLRLGPQPPPPPLPRTIAIVAREAELHARCLEAIGRAGLVHDPRAPDVVLCCGGDGTLLLAERTFPGVPKLAIRDSEVGFHCQAASPELAIQKLMAGEGLISSYQKVRALTGDGAREGLNDIVLRNVLPTEAIRFRVSVDEGPEIDELIGDGVVIATTFGATGYFQSITKQTFTAGLGLAFNNVTRELPPVLLHDTAAIRIVLTRGEAVLTADNDPRGLVVRAGDQILVRTSPSRAQLLRLPIGRGIEGELGSQVANWGSYEDLPGRL